MITLKDGATVLRQMAAGTKPEIIIIGLDPWMFSNAGDNVFYPGIEATGTEFQLDMLFQPCAWLLQRKMTFPYYLQVLTGTCQQPFRPWGSLRRSTRRGFISTVRSITWGG